MRALGGLGVALFCAGGLMAQYRGSATPYMTGGFSNAVYPGGTPATVPGMTRFRSNVVYPGGGGPQLHVPYSSSSLQRSRSAAGAGFVYSYPVYVGGYYDPSAYGYADPAAGAPQQPGNVTVIYPPAPAPASPVIINVGIPPASGAAGQPAPPNTAYQAPPEQPQEDTSAPEPVHYLIALKDHTIYSAVAYWVDGSTLHYFTSGNTHNQVSLSLVDRDLTQRLNREGGLEVKLPPAK